MRAPGAAPEAASGRSSAARCRPVSVRGPLTPLQRLPGRLSGTGSLARHPCARSLAAGHAQSPVKRSCLRPGPRYTQSTSGWHPGGAEPASPAGRATRRACSPLQDVPGNFLKTQATRTERLGWAARFVRGVRVSCAGRRAGDVKLPTRPHPRASRARHTLPLPAGRTTHAAGGGWPGRAPGAGPPRGRRRGPPRRRPSGRR